MSKPTIIIGLVTLTLLLALALPTHAAPGDTTRVSVDSNGAQANGISGVPAISADGRYVAFESDATNLVSGDTNNFNGQGMARSPASARRTPQTSSCCRPAT